MSVAPSSSEIFQRAVDEGERRLDQSLLELVSTSFIAGFTIVFGLAALGIAHALVEPELGRVARIAGALAFAVGFALLIAGRTELFTENFFDPIATAFARRERRVLLRILRLWGITLAFNLVGGVLLALVVAVEGVLPPGAGEALAGVAEDLAMRGVWAGLASAVVGGGLVALLSFLLQAVDSVGSRIALAFGVGFLLALGPFDHVIVTVLHLVLGLLLGASVGAGAVATVFAVATAGNLLGGVGLVTLSHVAQAEGADEPVDDGAPED